jgi:hypothetical protein
MSLAGRMARKIQPVLRAAGLLMVVASGVLTLGPPEWRGGKSFFWIPFVVYAIGITLSWPYFIKFLRSDDNSGFAKFFIMFPVLVILLVLSVPAVVFVVSGGNAASSLSAAKALSDRTFEVRPILEAIVLDLVPSLLVGLPLLLRGRLTFQDASPLARSLATGWITAIALVLTCLYLFLQHFFKGPLVGLKPGALFAAIVATAVILAPLYRRITEACWRRGIIDILDPATWGKTWQKVIIEIKSPSSHSAASREPATGAVDRTTLEQQAVAGDGSGQITPSR